MDIIDVSGGPPASAVATFSRASYRLADLPPTLGSIQWSLSGDLSSLGIIGADSGEQVALASSHRSESAGATTLIATFTPANQGPPVVASLALTVFAAHIANADGSEPPVGTLGVGNRVRYRPQSLPAVGGLAFNWMPSFEGGVAVAGVADSGEVEILGQAASQPGRDAMLQLTVTAVGGQVATATRAIAVFDVEIELASPQPEGLCPASGRMGVGDVRVATAHVRPPGILPPGLEPPVGASWSWSTGCELQPLGNTDGAVASLLAVGAGAGAWVEAALSLAGSTVRARRGLIVHDVRIEACDGGTPADVLPVGATLALRARIEPPFDEAQVFWAGGDAMALREAQGQAWVTGVEPSAAEGADGVAATVVMGDAQAHALIPLTVFSVAICAVGGGPPPTALPINSRQRYAMVTTPPVSQCAVSWAVTGAAALTGPTTQAEVDLITFGQSETAGDVALGVSVVPERFTPAVAPVVLNLTVGTPRR